MYNAISKIVEVLYAFLQGYCLQYFLGEFLESRRLKRNWNGLLVTMLYGVWKLGLHFILPSNNESITVIKNQILILLFLLALAMCFYQAAHRITVFLIITFMAVSEISFFLAYTVMQIGNNLFDLWSWCFLNGYISATAYFKWITELTVFGLQALLCAVCIILSYASLRSIAHSYRAKDYAIHRTELLFILAPGLVGLFICVLLRVIMITVEDGATEILYDKYPVLFLVVPAILILSLLSILYGVKLFQDMIALNREKSNRIILEKQIESMKMHIREMEHVYSGIRSMKHDMKNTLAIVMQLAAGNKADEALQAYLAELGKTMERLDVRFATGNTVVDTLLSMKYHEAVRAIPDLQMHTDQLLFPKTLLIQSFDIGIILGNALDNAIEACSKLREKEPGADVFIRLASFQKGKMFFIEIENSFDGKILRKRQAEFPATDKADKEMHGIGLINIKNAAEKYHGAVDWSADHKIFTLSIMMKNERSAGNEC